MKYGKAVIIGAGALGLGFLTERMAKEYEICLVDTAGKSEVLGRIEQDQRFTVNICGLDGITLREVQGPFRTVISDSPSGRDMLNEALAEADLVLTVTGRKILDRLVPEIAPALNAGSRKRWLLFCENGLDIAGSFAGHFTEQTVPVDTVMSRMCRFAGPDEPGYTPLLNGGDVSLVVEEYGYLPLDAGACAGGPFSDAFSMVSHEEFLCWEDVKLYLHNGMHAYIAYHAILEDVRFFPDTPGSIRGKAKDVMLSEVVPAIVRTHSCAGRMEIEQYALSLLDRFFNPFFRDSIERGARGATEKLAPGERIVGGCEYIKRAMIEPVGYASTIEAAKKALAMGRA